jgi:hypothetical protein
MSSDMYHMGGEAKSRHRGRTIFLRETIASCCAVVLARLFGVWRQLITAKAIGPLVKSHDGLFSFGAYTVAPTAALVVIRAHIFQRRSDIRVASLCFHCGGIGTAQQESRKGDCGH